MKIKVPQTIKIGAHTYENVLMTGLKIDQDRRGIADHRRQRVELEASMPPTMLLAVWLHEIVHIIDEVYSCKTDEDTTDRIAQGLADLFTNWGIEFDWSEIKELSQ